MQLINAPGKLVLPFANAGAKNSIPVDSQIGIVGGAASLTDGFPPLTRTPLAAGGVPPSGLDMNGILYELSAVIRWANAGGGYPYDSNFVTDANVQGYPKGARVLRSDGTGYWFNTTDGNTTDPEGAGAVAAGWVPDFTNGVAAVTMTGSNVTLTALEYGKPVIVISGLLTANLNLIFPSIVGEWIVINSTTGPYTITCKTAAGTGVVVNSVQALVGDATNIYRAANDAISCMGELIASAGGTADALTVALAPAWRAWQNGVPFFVRAVSVNATTTPTVAVGALAAKTLVKGTNAALVAGDIAGAGHWLLMQYDVTLDKVVLLNPAFGLNTSLVRQIQPVGATVAANAMTVTLNPTNLDFRSTTLNSGTVNARNVGSQLSLTIPSTATLGTISGVASRIILLAIENAGTVELAVYNAAGGANLDETGTINTTAIAGGSNSLTVYSQTARTGVPYRIVGFVDSTQATAGTWATAPSAVQGIGGQALAAMSSLGYGQTWQNVTGSRAAGITYYNTTGKPILVNFSGQGNLTTGSATLTVSGVVAGYAYYFFNSGSATHPQTLSAVIPPGASYVMSLSNVTIDYWSELR